MGRDRHGIEATSKIDLMMIKEDILEVVPDVKTVKVLGGGISPYSNVLCKVKLVDT